VSGQQTKGRKMPPVEFPGTWESRYRVQIKKRPGSIGLIAEGDSWFSFPKFIRTNLVLELDEWSGDSAALWSLARNGDTAQEIMFGQQYGTLRRLFSDATLRIDGFLFSAGGNDLVAENLPNFLNTYEAGMKWLDCINMPYLDLKFRDVQAAYQRLIDLRDAYRPNTYIFTHAYDFAVPSGKKVHFLLFTAGGWLKDQFLTKGIKDKAIQQEIVTYLLTRFGKMQETLESITDRFVYVRTQGTLDKGKDWQDELHPSTEGFKKVVVKFEKALKTVFKSLPKPSSRLTIS
jgi:hypothetical protein